MRILHPESKKEVFISTALGRADDQFDKISISSKNLDLEAFGELTENNVDINTPMRWGINELLSAVPSDLSDAALDMDHADYWLIQLGMLATPVKNSHMTWARFRVQFRSDTPDASFSIESIFPKRQPSEYIGTIYVDSMLRFSNSSKHPANAVFGIPFSVEERVNIRGVIKENAVLWDLRGDIIFGEYSFYLILKKKREATLQAEFSFNATLHTPGYHDVLVRGVDLLGGKVFIFT